MSKKRQPKRTTYRMQPDVADILSAGADLWGVSENALANTLIRLGYSAAMSDTFRTNLTRNRLENLRHAQFARKMAETARKAAMDSKPPPLDKVKGLPQPV